MFWYESSQLSHGNAFRLYRGNEGIEDDFHYLPGFSFDSGDTDMNSRLSPGSCVISVKREVQEKQERATLLLPTYFLVVSL